MPESAAAVALLHSLPIGTRVVVRRREDDGFHDALGYLAAIDDTSCTIDTRSGPVAVAWAAVTRAKPVPPPPARRSPRSRDQRATDMHAADQRPQDSA